VQLDRRTFVRLSSCGAGILWATPRIRSVAPAQAGTPAPRSTPPTSTPTSEPPEVASDVVVPPAPAEVAPASTGETAPDVHAKVEGVRNPLAVTGTEIGQMTALGVGAIMGGFGLRYAAGWFETDEVEPCPPDPDSPDPDSPDLDWCGAVPG